MNIVWAIKLLIPVTLVLVGVVMVLRRPAQDWLSAADVRTTVHGLVAASVVAFLSFSTVTFAIGTAAVALWLSQRYGGGNSGRLAAYALLMATMPPSEWKLENLGGIGYLTSLGPIRVLSVALLIPALMTQPSRSRGDAMPGWLRLCDVGILGYVAMMVSLAWGDTVTVLVRLGVETTLDVAVPYLALTRCAVSRDGRQRMLGVFVLAMAGQAVLAAIESVSGHQFYNGLQYIIGTAWQLTWVEVRSGFLRGQAAPQGPLVLATMLLLALGAWAAMPRARGGKTAWLPALLLLAGIWSTFGRAAWLCTALLGVSLWLLPRIGGRGYVLSVFALTTVTIFGWTSGLGAQLTEAVIDLFDAEGRESFNILYRQELLNASIALIRQSPWFGVGDFTQHLAYLRQGEGIIDLVNTYLVVTLNVGVVGLALLMTPFLIALWKLAQLVPRGTPALGREAPAWLAMTVALMALVFTVSPIRQVMQMLIWAAALAIAHLASLERPRR